MTIVHRGDFLNLTIDGQPWFEWVGNYYTADAVARDRIYSELHARGYTHGPSLNLFEGQVACDYFADPYALQPFLGEIVDAGLIPVLEMGPEGDKAAQQRYRGVKYLAQLARFAPVVAPFAPDFLLGVECPEYWSRDDTRANTTMLRELCPAAPIWIHLSTPAKTDTPARWWRQWRGWISSDATGLAFQYPKRDEKNGFLASPKDVRTWTAYLAAKLHARGQLCLAGEYAFRRAEFEARTLGALALAAGADGFMNGGPPEA